MTHCRRLVLFGLLIILGGSPSRLLAGTPPTPPTSQQIYNEAQAAFENSDWAAAIKGFASIAKPYIDEEMPYYQGIIHARLAQAYAYRRMLQEAEHEVPLALRGIALNNNYEVSLTWLTLGEAQRYELSLTQAIDSYGKGLEAAQQAKRAELVTRAEVGLALCYMTISPDKAARLMDAILAAPEAASYPKPLHAQYLALRGRASLNLGQAREAMPFLAKAVDMSGGLAGSQVNLVQVGIRGDAALGALLADRKGDAHEYLNWTGAGHLPSEEWTSGLGDPPVCSEAANIRPEDLVIVEFSIGDDGHVLGAAPIYVSRPGMMGIAFAKTVKTWKWNPERIAALPSFWRHLVRIELRCLSRPDPKKLSEPFRLETDRWLTDNHLAPEDLAPLHDEYVTGDDPRLQRDDLAAIPALFTRLRIETNHKHAVAIAKHLADALDKSHAPVAARALAMNMEPMEGAAAWSAERVRAYAKHVESLERTDPQSAATAWITLEYAIALESNGRFKDARPVLERVLAYPLDAVGEHDPLRDVATLHLAAMQRRTGDSAGADTTVKSAGITNAQCMLFDVRPVVTDNSVYDSDFPSEAQRWGFDGYVRETFDIDAGGNVRNTRTIIAYPPFIFGASAEHAIAHFHYFAPVIDGASVGCEGHTIGLKYRANL